MQQLRHLPTVQQRRIEEEVIDPRVETARGQGPAEGLRAFLGVHQPLPHPVGHGPLRALPLVVPPHGFDLRQRLRRVVVRGEGVEVPAPDLREPTLDLGLGRDLGLERRVDLDLDGLDLGAAEGLGHVVEVDVVEEEVEVGGVGVDLDPGHDVTRIPTWALLPVNEEKYFFMKCLIDLFRVSGEL